MGSRWERLQHEVWFNLAPNGERVEARLSGFGVELERPPVETAR